MTKFLLVCLAGAIGTGLRYGVGLWAGRAIGTGFPYGTLLVNVVGCFLIAAIAHVALVSTLVSDTLKVTLMTGFVGGLTTYSAFNLDTTRLLEQRAWALGALYVSLTLFVSFGAGLLGYAVARRLVGP
jgi:fluoride exporter